MLRLIETASPDFQMKRSSILDEAERKLVKLLLDENKVMYEKMENKFDLVLRAENLVNYTYVKDEIIKGNVTLKITLRERGKRNGENLKGRSVLLENQKEVVIKYQTLLN